MIVSSAYIPAADSSDNKTNLKFVVLISLVAAIGGLLFGYDTGVIAGAIVFMQKKFTLDPMMTGWAVSSALIGSIVGASIAGALSDRFGRKTILLLSALLFTVSAIATALPNDMNTFVMARMIGGLAIGITSMVSPMYIAEIAPAAIRGRLVSLQQLAIVTGFFVVYFANLTITGMGDELWNIEYGWRWMFGSAVVPSVFFLLLLFVVPETPRWLSKQGENDKALAVLTQVGGAEYGKQELHEIVNAVTEESASLSQLLQPGFRRALGIAIVLAVLQQVTGINAIMYYAPIIFQKIGSSTDNAMMSTVLVGTVNLLFTFVALWLIDQAGRKALMLAGSIGMAIALAGAGASFHFHLDSAWVLTFILMFIASFAASMGPIVWVIISEIFPTKIRGRAVSIATMILWIATFGVSQTFPMLLSSIGPAYTFWAYMSMAVFSIFFVWKAVPETKGLSLEEIEHLWVKK